jgi:catechol 2,3-dioxygenase-like lactoylglutathione lyase family enzyme
VLVSHDLPAMEAFYGQVLGFGVTERLDTQVGPIAIRGIFMHCNARHHSLALFDLPSAKRLHHFMLQANDVMDVGRARERAAELGVPLAHELGQHPHPDGTFSFYGITPSGFDFEIGAGSGEIDPATWGATRTAVTSSWGHRPQWRLKLRMARALVAHKLGRRGVKAGTRP